MRNGLIRWLAGKAGDYLAWVARHDLAAARRSEEECLDCEMPESYCFCDAEFAREQVMRDEFNAGAAQGYEEARRELGASDGW